MKTKKILKKVKKTLNRKNILLVAVFFFALFTRFYWLDKIPVGLSHDEIEYVTSARSYAKLGKDASGVNFPNSLVNTKTEGRIAELPALINAPFFALVPVNQITAKIPYIFFNLATGLILWLISKRLFNSKVAWIALVFWIINPWSIVWGRSAYEVSIALFFYILSIYLFLLNSNRLWFLLPMILGFLSYHGYKFIFFPLALVLLSYQHLLAKSKSNNKKSLKTIFLLLVFMLVYVATVLVFSNKSGGTLSRKKDLIFFNLQKYSRAVDKARRLSIASPLNKVFLNKPLFMLKDFCSRYISAFSIKRLFLSASDDRAVYNLYQHGWFYSVDLVFLFVGLFILAKKYPKKLYLFLGLILISPIPSAVSGVEESYVLRSSLMYPAISLLTAYGVYVFSKSAKSKKILIGLTTASYLFSFIVFIHFYLFRLPLVNPKIFFLDERLLSKYLSLVPLDKSVYVYTQYPRCVLYKYFFYTHKFNDSQTLKQSIMPNFGSLDKSELKHQNITFAQTCPNKEADYDVYIIDGFKDCQLSKTNKINISSPSDAGVFFRIYNDLVCQPDYHKMGTYIRSLSAQDLNLNQLNKMEFCQKWLTLN